LLGIAKQVFDKVLKLSKELKLTKKEKGMVGALTEEIEIP
jgi:hypothetical protein